MQGAAILQAGFGAHLAFAGESFRHRESQTAFLALLDVETPAWEALDFGQQSQTPATLEWNQAELDSATVRAEHTFLRASDASVWQALAQPAVNGGLASCSVRLIQRQKVGTL